MLIKQLLLILIGASSGFVIAGGLYSFIVTVGVLTRLSTRTNTASRVMLYEDVVTIGSGVGNWLYFSQFEVKLGPIFLVLVGICVGVFTGCLAIALAEVLNVIPTFVRRTRLKRGLAGILCAMGLGKLIGSLFQLVWMVKE